MLNALKAAYFKLRIAHLDHLIDVLIADQNVAADEGNAAQVLTIDTEILTLQGERSAFVRRLRAIPQPT